MILDIKHNAETLLKGNLETDSGVICININNNENKILVISDYGFVIDSVKYSFESKSELPFSVYPGKSKMFIEEDKRIKTKVFHLGLCVKNNTRIKFYVKCGVDYISTTSILYKDLY